MSIHRYMYYVFVVFICACTSPDDDFVTMDMIGGIPISLIQIDAKCGVNFNIDGKVKTLVLQIPWPCQLHRSLQKSIRAVAVDNSLVILAENSTPDPKYPDDCITYTQAIKIENLNLSQAKHFSKVAACPPFQWDEKMFLAAVF